MTDDDLRAELQHFGIDEASRGVVCLLPVAWVAWADGTIQPEEHAIITQMASNVVDLGPEGQRVLDNWLAFAPSKERVERGAALILGLSVRSRLPANADVVDLCTRVAEAVGPLLGKVNPAERESVESIARSLAVEPHAAWEKVQSRLIVECAPAVEDGWFDDEKTNPFGVRPAAAKPSVRPVPPKAGEPGLAWSVGGDEQRVIVGSSLRIGRGRENDLQMHHDGQISRHHCVLERREGGVYVRDLGGVNGTYVEGEQVLERKLFGGEVLTLGDTSFRFRA
jgi:pSer/pThr/pTyr-binding forkhead associated (FHA) protein